MARRRRPPSDATFALTCPHCGRNLLMFVLFPDDRNPESGTYQQSLTADTVEYLKGLSGNCPDHFLPDSIAEEFYG